ncbi:glycosyltransferase family 2 protein [Candidatus Latescibacterota bacterium]
MKYSLIVISLNEVEGMKATLPKIDKNLFHERLVIDGGSTDGSIEYAESLGYTVIRQKSKGVVGGLREGIDAATGDALLMYTPDNNMIPEKIPEMIAKMEEGYDMVVASRYLNGAKSYDDTIISGFGNWMFTTLNRVIFGCKTTDVLQLFRIIRKDMFTKLNMEIGLSFTTRLWIRGTQAKLKLGEISGDEPARIGGESSRSIIKNGLVEVFTILEEFFRLMSIKLSEPK